MDTISEFEKFMKDEITPYVVDSIKVNMLKSYKDGYYDGSVNISKKLIDVIGNNELSKDVLLLTLNNVIKGIQKLQ